MPQAGRQGDQDSLQSGGRRPQLEEPRQGQEAHSKLRVCRPPDRASSDPRGAQLLQASWPSPRTHAFAHRHRRRFAVRQTHLAEMTKAKEQKLIHSYLLTIRRNPRSSEGVSTSREQYSVDPLVGSGPTGCAIFHGRATQPGLPPCASHPAALRRCRRISPALRKRPKGRTVGPLPSQRLADDGQPRRSFRAAQSTASRVKA